MSYPPVSLAKAHGKVLLFTLLISLSFPIGSALTAVLDPLVVTWVRYLLASLIFVGVLGYQGRFALPSLRDLGRYTLISLPALCYFVAMFVALQETSALDASALYTTVPLISALAGMVIFRRAIGWGMGLALLGAWWPRPSSSFAAIWDWWRTSASLPAIASTCSAAWPWPSTPS